MVDFINKSYPIFKKKIITILCKFFLKILEKETNPDLLSDASKTMTLHFPDKFTRKAHYQIIYLMNIDTHF